MGDYLGKIHGLLHDFNELFPSDSTHAQDLEQLGIFLMSLASNGLSMEYSLARDQILVSPTIPTLNPIWSTLLHIQAKHPASV